MEWGMFIAFMLLTIFMFFYMVRTHRMWEKRYDELLNINMQLTAAYKEVQIGGQQVPQPFIPEEELDRAAHGV
jgi:hypothetical protein